VEQLCNLLEKAAAAGDPDAPAVAARLAAAAARNTGAPLASPDPERAGRAVRLRCAARLTAVRRPPRTRPKLAAAA